MLIDYSADKKTSPCVNLMSHICDGKLPSVIKGSCVLLIFVNALTGNGTFLNEAVNSCLNIFILFYELRQGLNIKMVITFRILLVIAHMYSRDCLLLLESCNSIEIMGNQLNMTMKQFHS